jgi:hypothetical protein
VKPSIAASLNKMFCNPLGKPKNLDVRLDETSVNSLMDDHVRWVITHPQRAYFRHKPIRCISLPYKTCLDYKFGVAVEKQTEAHMFILKSQSNDVLYYISFSQIVGLDVSEICMRDSKHGSRLSTKWGRGFHLGNFLVY